MRQVVFALRFTGQAEPLGGTGDVMRAATTAPSLALVTMVGPDGVTGTLAPLSGEPATFESDLTLVGGTAFQESGTIAFGRDHRLRFSTVGNGYLGPSADPGLRQGAAIWQIESGDGQFLGASGLITSNFVLDSAMGVIDHQFGVALLPEISFRSGVAATGATSAASRSREPP